MDPAMPRSACLRASSRMRFVRKRRNSNAIRMIMMGPPTNSASVNCQPSSSAKIKPSSMTRLVDANWNAIAAVKSAPLRNSERASATAAYEQDDDAAPSPVAVARLRGRSSGSARAIVDFLTSASITAASVKPRISDQVTCQVMVPATRNACRIGTVNRLPSRRRNPTSLGYCDGQRGAWHPCPAIQPQRARRAAASVRLRMVATDVRADAGSAVVRETTEAAATRHVPGAAGDQPQADAEDQAEGNASDEHAERIERDERLTEDLRRVAWPAGAVVGKDQTGEGPNPSGQQRSENDQHHGRLPPRDGRALTYRIGMSGSPHQTPRSERRAIRYTSIMRATFAYPVVTNRVERARNSAVAPGAHPGATAADAGCAGARRDLRRWRCWYRASSRAGPGVPAFSD